MKKFKRTERITLLAVFLATVPILVLTFVNGRNWGGDIVTQYSYWVWNAIIVQIAPGLYCLSGHPAPVAFLLVLGITFLVFLPMSLRSRTRYSGAVGLMASSYVFAAFLWVYSLGIVWVIWGAAGVIVGLCFVYVGIIPEAFIVTLYIIVSAGLGGMYMLRLELLFTMLILAACFTAARLLMKRALKKIEKELPEGQ